MREDGTLAQRAARGGGLAVSVGGGSSRGRSLLHPFHGAYFITGAALIGYLIWCEDWLLIEWSVIMLGIESRGFEVVNEETTKKLRREW